MLRPLLLASTTFALGAGCAPPFIVTDSFTVRDTGLFASAEDSLHDYVVGSPFVLEVRAGRAFVDLKNVEVVSKTPDLLAVEGQNFIDDTIVVDMRALAEGTASLAFLDDRQRPLEERVIEVKLPDEIELSVDVDPEKKFTIPIIDGENLLISVDGKVTFQVTYKRDGSEVKGTSVLSGASDAYVIENPTRATPDREFVTITAGNSASEITDIGLFVAETLIRNLRATTVDTTAIASVQLDEGELPDWKNDGDVYTVWSKSFTTDGAPIWGAPFAWTFDSEPVEGAGDLLRYTRQGGERRLVQVRSGDITEDLTVEAKAGTAQLSSTAVPGCSSTVAPASLFALLAALWFRRRR